jgi:integrase
LQRVLHKLTAVAVKSAGPGKYNDGHGLWLVKRKDGGGQWVLRLAIFGKRREMGLGSTAEVSLKQARETAAKWRAIVRDGKDPIRERETQKLNSRDIAVTLEAMAVEAFDARKSELKGDGKAGRWFSPLAVHVLPRLGRRPVSQLHQNDIRDCLAPIWHDKADAAKKAMTRLGIVMRFAAAKGHEVDLQATAKAKELLGKSRYEAGHIASLQWQEVPAFYMSLNELSVTHLALRLLILTGVRSLPIRAMTIDQIDGDCWTIPAHLMKGTKGKTQQFRVPLSSEVLKIINQARPFARNGLLFAAPRGGMMSDATMSRLMERRGMEARPHGFRSSLRVWLSEATDAPFEIAEAMLSHTVGSSVTRAYQRSDFLEQRRVLLERWAEHVCCAPLLEHTPERW